MTKNYRIAIVGWPTERQRRHLAAVLNGYGYEEEPDIWQCWMSEEQRRRLEAFHPGLLRIGEVRP